MEYETEINVQIKWGALQHWAAQQTTLHREVEECNREHELDLASHNEKTDVSYFLARMKPKVCFVNIQLNTNYKKFL